MKMDQFSTRNVVLWIHCEARYSSLGMARPLFEDEVNQTLLQSPRVVGVEAPIAFLSTGNCQDP